MELSQLRYFIAVAKLGNMSKAAETLFVSQPNLSTSISRLEEEVGVPLFERRRGKIALNQNGELLLKSVEQAVSLLDAGVQAVRNQHSGRPEPLSIVCMTDDTTLLEHFLLEHPEVNLIHQRADLPNVTSLLDRCEVDLAMTVLPPPSEEVVYERIYACNFGMLMRREHPLAALPAVAHRELAGVHLAIDGSRVNKETFCAAENSKFGLTPIIDGNVTIVIVAIVLMGAFGPSDGFFAKALHFVFFAFGPSTAGTIYAFGYTLLTGVLLNFVFGIFATRTMIRGAAAIKALRDPRLYGADAPGKIPAEKKQVNFVGLRKRFLTFSACLMAAIVLCAVVLGVHLDTEFTGGAMITLSYENSFEMSAVQKTASEALGSNGLTLQTGENVATGEQTLKISMPGTETVTTDEVQTLLDSLNESYPDNSFAQLSLSNVSAAMGTKFLQKSLVAVVFALVLILAYIAYRFKNIGGLTGGMMAVLALLNDLMVVFGTFVLLRAPLDGNFIAAMLTILGYSINDTVVVYDRIRENRGLLGKKASFEELVNHSVNQSARRTIITTVTTVMALGVMCIVSKLYGLDSIFTFAFPLMMGMLSGVYTSLCVSTSAWVAWSERKGAKKN